MTKKKYKSLISVVLLLLCVAPLLFCALALFNDSTDFNVINYTEYVKRFEISEELSNKIADGVQSFGISFDGAFFPAVCVIMSNALLIYVFYVFTAVLLFIPKYSIKLMERGVDFD